MNETVEVEFGLSFIQLINVVSWTREFQTVTHFSFLSSSFRCLHPSAICFIPSNGRLHITCCEIERKESNNDVERLAPNGEYFVFLPYLLEILSPGTSSHCFNNWHHSRCALISRKGMENVQSLQLVSYTLAMPSNLIPYFLFFLISWPKMFFSSHNTLSTGLSQVN